MSAYDGGLRAHAAGLGAGVVDVAMPGNIRDEIVTIGTGFRTLDAAIQAARASLPADFVAGWGGFLVEWNGFAKNHASWLDNVWYKSYEKALEYRKRLEEWRTKFIGLGGKVSTPSPGAAPGGAPGGINWKMLIYVGAGVGALWAATKFLGQSIDVKRELVGARPLVAPTGAVKNPPPWVIDPDLWESAKLAIQPYRDRYDNPLAVTTHVYKQMGGRVG